MFFNKRVKEIALKKAKKKKKMTIGVDVGLCVVDTGTEYFKWVCRQIGADADYYLSESREFPYNLSKMFSDELREHGVDSMDFWRQRGLYDDLTPVIGAMATLHLLSQEGHDVIFITKLKGDHHKSKCYFLKKHFPFLKGIIGTHEKFIMEPVIDVMIDDRVENLYTFNTKEVVGIIPPNRFEQSSKVNKDWVYDYSQEKPDIGWFLIYNLLK